MLFKTILTQGAFFNWYPCILFLPGAKLPKATGRQSHHFHRFYIEGRDLLFERQELIFPNELADISKRYSAAVAKNREWWKAYVKPYIDLKQPIPYHEKFGITSKEWERYNQLSENPPSTTLKPLEVQK